MFRIASAVLELLFADDRPLALDVGDLCSFDFRGLFFGLDRREGESESDVSNDDTRAVDLTFASLPLVFL